ncbi:MAG: PAS domain-containing protein, partial [Burkholderiaceae bacterium]
MLTIEEIREILRLKMQVGLSHQRVADTTGLSKAVVAKYIGMAAKQGLDWPAVCLLSQSGLMQRLQKGEQRRPLSYVLPDYGSIHLRLACAGMTLLREWERYKTAHAQQKTYGYTQFCGRYRTFVQGLARSLRQVSRAGERMFAYIADAPVSLNGGGCAHIFLATMAASRYAFACAIPEASAAGWTRSAARALDFFGGVPRLIIPVGAPGRMPGYAATDMDLVRDFARHYGTSVLWSMPEDPKEKTWAALSNRVLERWLLLGLARCRPGSVEDVEQALQRLLTYLNQHRLRGLPGSRASAFTELDSPALFALPAQHYAIPLPERIETKMNLGPDFLPAGSKPKIVLMEADAGMRTYPRRLLGRDDKVIARRRAEQLRVETSNILDSLDEAFMRVDGGWGIHYLNAAAERAIGLSRAHLLKNNYWKAFSAMRGTLVELEYRRAMSSRLPVRFEHYDVRKNVWTEMNAWPTEDGGLLLSGRDITESKRGQETQARLNLELQATSQLQELGARLLEMPDLDSALREALNGSIAIVHAATAVIQLYNPRA